MFSIWIEWDFAWCNVFSVSTDLKNRTRTAGTSCQLIVDNSVWRALLDKHISVSGCRKKNDLRCPLLCRVQRLSATTDIFFFSCSPISPWRWMPSTCRRRCSPVISDVPTASDVRRLSFRNWFTLYRRCCSVSQLYNQSSVYATYWIAVCHSQRPRLLSR